MAEGSENHLYDFCIFYQEQEKQDRDVAIAILKYLEEIEHKPLYGYIEERDAMPGQTCINNMDNVITNSRLIIVILSQAALECNWFELKLHASLTHRLNSNLCNTVIPVYTGHFKTLPPSLITIDGIYYDADKQSRFWKKLQQLF
ncbi:hypothetical protein CHS0354_005204 [Potamilus streckersoni]|uniref:TIR domain-containing protein n=1 Tax=Potamilus streckersoni TaxID=2493646 RepID=A0AAE0VNX9_9BIVA|nr:hypothetical protein CHS0354_005204 [Potamilus streckersoni]